MVKVLATNTTAALQNAPTLGLVVRDFVTIWPKTRDTGDVDQFGLWTDIAPLTVNVIKPSDGSTVARDFVGAGSLLDIQSIPSTMALEVRTIRVKLSKLSPSILEVFRTYDARLAPIQIHRGIFDPSTRQLVDPATCRFDGFVNNAPIRTPKTGSSGDVTVECTSFSRILTRTSGQKFSDAMISQRSGDGFGKYTDVAGNFRIWWGQDQTVISTPQRAKDRFHRV